MVPLVFQKRGWFHKVNLAALILLSGGMLTVFTTHIRVQKTEMPLPDVTRWAVRQPVLIFWLILTVMLGYLVFLLVRQIRHRRSAITRFSIKDGLDSLSSGLCFYEPGGRVILANSCMQELSHKLMGRDVQNAALFWQLLQKGEVADGVSCLSRGDAPAFRLKDGTVWSFGWQMLDGICQLTAADTTQIHDLTVRLEQVLQQIRITELAHAQNPLPVRYGTEI